MPNPIVKATQVEKTYVDGDRTLRVLSGVTLEIERGRSVAIVGRSGSGKSTLLHLLGALDRPTTGSVLFDGKPLEGMSDGELARLRARHVGFIYQFHHLLPEFTALENVLLPGMILGGNHADLVKRAEFLLASVGLSDRSTHRPAKLSGGERQRVALARALMNDPDVVLADEPTGDLDETTGREVIDFVVGQTVKMQKAVVLVTHDPSLAARADECHRLDAGVLRRER